MKSRSIALALLLLCGCATGATATRLTYAFEPAPAQTSGWLEIVTPDFTLRTDQSPEQAERAAQLLAESLAGLRAMFGRAPQVGPLKLEVYALKDDLDFERRFGKRTWGFAWAGGPTSSIFLYGPPDRWFVRSALTYEASQSVLQHELAHVVLRQYFRQQPQWFAEGMAQYLETFRWLDAETVRFGDMNLQAYRNYTAARSLTVAQLLKWQTVAQRESEVYGMYGLSWAFVHYALNKQPREFGTYMTLLAQRGPDEAWQQTFGHAADLDQSVYGYMKIGAYQFRLAKVPAASPVPARVQVMSAEALAAMGTLFQEMEKGMRVHNGS